MLHVFTFLSLPSPSANRKEKHKILYQLHSHLTDCAKDQKRTQTQFNIILLLLLLL